MHPYPPLSPLPAGERDGVRGKRSGSFTRVIDDERATDTKEFFDFFIFLSDFQRRLQLHGEK